MTSLAEIRDRLSYAAPPDHRIYLLGDSVLGASALMEHRIPQARIQTLSRQLKQRLADAGVNAVSLGSDGLLMPDIDGLTAEFSAAPPEKVLLLLNFPDVLQEEFGEGSKALSRYFLFPDLPDEVQKRLVPDKPPTPEAELSDRLYAGMCDPLVSFPGNPNVEDPLVLPQPKGFFSTPTGANRGEE